MMQEYNNFFSCSVPVFRGLSPGSALTIHFLILNAYCESLKDFSALSFECMFQTRVLVCHSRPSNGE